MRKMLAFVVLSISLLPGCAAVVVHQPVHHVRVVPQCPTQDIPREKPPVGPDTGASLYFFRLGW